MLSPIRPHLSPWLSLEKDERLPMAIFPSERLRRNMGAHYRLSPEAIEWARHFAKGRVSLMSRTIEYPLAEFPWNWNAFGRLWQFELHYLDALPLLVFSDSEDDNDLALELLENWRAHNLPGSDPGWGPYPLSRRILNFCRCLTGIARPSPLRKGLVEALTESIPWLWSFQETHIRANHLICNVHALLTATLLLPSFDYLQSRRDSILQSALEQWDEQFLPDGGHYERSPGYHAQILRELMELQHLLNENVPVHYSSVRSRLEPLVHQSIHFMDNLLHPDGKPSFFHDSNASMPLFHFGEDNTAMESGTTLFPDSGFGVARNRDWYTVLFNGEPGPPYQPGHAHCDALSFEASYRGHRVFTNAGVAGYGEAPDRQWMRSADAHSTVVIDGHVQHEVWSNFRVGFRGQPGLVQASSSPEKMCLQSSFLYADAEALNHQRKVTLENQSIAVMDEISGAAENTYRALYHLHPEMHLDLENNRIVGPMGEFSIVFRNAKTLCTTTPYMPQFGVRIPRACLSLMPQSPGPFGLTLTAI